MALFDWRTMLLALPGILVAMTFHEYAHGVVALRLGDPTALRAGRLSPEPWAHIDWFGLVALLIFGFGWAKPVPIDPRYFRHPRRDMMWVGLAGPLSNFVMAFGFALALGVWSRIDPASMAQGVGYYAAEVVDAAFVLNVAFGLFNLIPIPPLDGSRVLAGMVPARVARGIYRLEPYGLVILVLALVATPFLTAVLNPLRQAVAGGLWAGAQWVVRGLWR
jgi:Zn-dependent protease